MSNIPADSKTTKELVAQALALCNSRETTVLNLLGVELKRVLGEFETFLDESSELTDAATLLTKDFLGVGGTDDDLKENIKIQSQTTIIARDCSLRFERG